MLENKFEKIDKDNKIEYIQALNNKMKIIKASLDNAYDGFFVADSDGNTVYYNDAYLRLANQNPSILDVTTVYERREMGLYTQSPTITTLKTGKISSSIYYKSPRKIISTAVPVFDDDGKLSAVVCNTRDIQKLKVLERNSVEDFTYMIKQAAKNELLRQRYEDEIEYQRQRFLSYKDVIGQSEAFRKVMELTYRIADTDSTVLITGHTGTGKEVIARQIHINSTRAKEAYIKVNCAAIPGNLLESELFGHEKGAFTGADRRKLGKFELAKGGTLLLDEIGEIDMYLQSKLLRVIQEKEFSRLGGLDLVSVDVRIIASTNKDLPKMVAEGKFRQDLYYRLNVVPIVLPSLRERKGDISLLATHFMKKYNEKNSKHRVLTSDALKLLERYSWPGNVRELANLMERIVVTSKENVINSEVLVDFMGDKYFTHLDSDYQISGGIRTTIENMEKKIIQKAISEYKSTRKAAKFLGTSQSYVVRKIKKYGIESQNIK